VKLVKLVAAYPFPIFPCSRSVNWGKSKLLLIFLSTLSAATVPECAALKHHGKLTDAKTCYTSLKDSRDAYTRAEAFWGLEQYKYAKDQFELALKEQPKNANIRVRFGRLFLERFNKAEAGKLFQEALALDEKNAAAYLGLALVAADGYSVKAVEYAQKAIEIDPKLVEAQELLAFVALEDNDVDKATKEADKAIAMSPEALDGLAIRASIDWLNDKPGTQWTDRILKINPVYGEAWITGGHFFVINRRYEEGIKAYHKAIELNPRLWEAHAQLALYLMRMGQEAEARKELQLCHDNEYTTAEVSNANTLLDSYARLVTFKSDVAIVRLDKKEADILQPYIEAEVKRVIATYEKKYQMKLDAPVHVDVYPDHEDLVIRTVGMPGLGGILGVTFTAPGMNAIAMDSPSSRSPGSFHWAATLWHEMSHVFVLNATRNRVPRWFTEGVAVYEESAAAPDWGDRLDVEALTAIEKKKLLPIEKLDRGYIRPEYPAQVVVSYFQGGQICTFIAEKWGYGTILKMMHSYAALKTTPEVVRQDLGLAPEEFDKQFLAWLEARTKTQVEHLAEWRKGMKEMIDAQTHEKWDEVIAKGNAIRDWYPDYVEHGSVYEALAEAYEKKGDKDAARAQLEKYSSVGGRNSVTIRKLATLEEEAGHKDKAEAALTRLNFIYPQDDELHRRLGALMLARHNVDAAIREYQAVIALKPIDQAAAHYGLAVALNMAKRTDEARDQVILALEAAPGYKPAQQLLLELSK
jgi:tetratricopeptide (TPR) repeat protein